VSGEQIDHLTLLIIGGGMVGVAVVAGLVAEVARLEHQAQQHPHQQRVDEVQSEGHGAEAIEGIREGGINSSLGT
jgi:hypothetical protein